MPEGLNDDRAAFWRLIEGVQEDIREIRGNQYKLFYTVFAATAAVIGILIAK